MTVPPTPSQRYDYTAPAQPGAQPKKSSGCWKWGAIGCIVVIVLFVGGIGAILAIVFGAIKSSDLYKGALLTAQKDPRVIAAIGSPVQPGFWVAGNVNVDGRTGQGEISFPISGPTGRAVVHAAGTKSAGTWHYDALSVKVRGSASEINLLQP